MPFVRELSVIAARSRAGEMACYPVGENRHENGILRTTHAPARLSETTKAEAEAIAKKTLQALDYVGVIGVELFELEDGSLRVNEFGCKPRGAQLRPLGPSTAVEVEASSRTTCAPWPAGRSARPRPWPR